MAARRGGPDNIGYADCGPAATHLGPGGNGEEGKRSQRLPSRVPWCPHRAGSVGLLEAIVVHIDATSAKVLSSGSILQETVTGASQVITLNPRPKREPKLRPMNIKHQEFKVSDFLSWQREGSLELSPSFQRRPVWKPSAKSYLIDTVVRGLPVPIIFIRERINLTTQTTIREVVDGQQRVSIQACD
jgi:Protein of unknown function DUF262